MGQKKIFDYNNSSFQFVQDSEERHFANVRETEISIDKYGRVAIKDFSKISDIDDTEFSTETIDLMKVSRFNRIY